MHVCSSKAHLLLFRTLQRNLTNVHPSSTNEAAVQSRPELASCGLEWMTSVNESESDQSLTMVRTRHNNNIASRTKKRTPRLFQMSREQLAHPSTLAGHVLLLPLNSLITSNSTKTRITWLDRRIVRSAVPIGLWLNGDYGLLNSLLMSPRWLLLRMLDSWETGGLIKMGKLHVYEIYGI